MVKNMLSFFTPFKLGSISRWQKPGRDGAADARPRRRAQYRAAPVAPHYYTQRASAGLIIREATQIRRSARATLDTRHLHREQIDGGAR